MANLMVRAGDTAQIDGALTLSGAAVPFSTVSTLMLSVYDAAACGGEVLLAKSVGSGITVVSATGGTFRVALSPSDTTLLRQSGNVPITRGYRLVMTDTSTNVYTVDAGVITVLG